MVLVLGVHDAARGDVNDLERELGFLEAEDLEKIPLSVVSRGPAVPAGQAPAVVDVITADEIRTSGARTLAELLEQRVGIDVSIDRVTPRGLNTSPSSPANEGLTLANNRTLLLVDGRPTNDVFFGEFLAGRELPLEHVARVEIIRGPGSALYGTNAMAGVINVVTKDAADTPGLGAIGEYGSFSTRRADAFGGIGGPRRNGSFFLRYFASGGTDQVSRNDDQREFFGFARGRLGPIRLYGEALNFREELPGAIDDGESEDRASRERYSIGASLDEKLGQAFRIAGRAYANLYQTRFLVENDEPDRKVYDEERFGQELSLTYDPRRWLSITLGGEVREEGGDVTPFGCVDADGDASASCEFDRNVYAAFLEDRIQLPWSLALTAGARYDELSGFDGRFSPRASVVWSPLAATAFKVGYGEAFRAPSFFELHGAQAF
ncbi:MAG: TonB-dependent receptor plug domain-containing protein, partial [Candidatus Binatia bacterium]